MNLNCNCGGSNRLCKRVATAAKSFSCEDLSHKIFFTYHEVSIPMSSNKCGKLVSISF